MRHQALLGLVLIIALAHRGVAQSAVPDTATMSGWVMDGSGRKIAGAIIDLTDPLTGQLLSTRSNVRGEYAMLISTQTRYRLNAHAAGHASYSEDAFHATTPRPLRIHFQLDDVAPVGQAIRPRPVAPATNFAGRSTLGAADAISASMQRGQITVVGTDDTVISYGVMRRGGWGFKYLNTDHINPGAGVAGTMNQVPGSPEEERSVTFMFTGKPATAVLLPAYRVTSGSGGLDIQVPGADSGDAALELSLFVPRNLKLLKLTIRAGGVVSVDGFDGELTIQSETGPVLLHGIGGPAVIEARNGRIRASITHLPAPARGGLDFLGRNGDVVVTLPGDAKADLDLETHGGQISADDFAGFASRTRPAANPDPGVLNANGLKASSPVRRTIAVGEGGTSVKLVAMNGSIVVTRADKP